MRLWILVLAAAFVFAACDAGHRDEPGVDNKWTGPELDIQVPGQGTTVQLTWAKPTTDDQGETVPGRKTRPQIFFRLRPMGEAGSIGVRYAIDEGAFADVKDENVAFELEQDLVPGTHLVSAFVVNEDGTPRFGARATSVTTFIVEAKDEASGQTLGTGGTKQLGHHDAEGFWQPFDPKAPCLIVQSAGGTVHVLAHRCALDGKRYRVSYSGAAEGKISGDDAESGRFGATLATNGAITVVLEEVVGDGDDRQWQPVAGSRSRWTGPTP